MSKYKVELQKDTCIGSFTCTMDVPDFWKEGEDGFAMLQGSSYNAETGNWELIIEESDLADNQRVEDGCPVEAIKISKLD